MNWNILDRIEAYLQKKQDARLGTDSQAEIENSEGLEKKFSNRPSEKRNLKTIDRQNQSLKDTEVMQDFSGHMNTEGENSNMGQRNF